VETVISRDQSVVKDDVIITWKQKRSRGRETSRRWTWIVHSADAGAGTGYGDAQRGEASFECEAEQSRVSNSDHREGSLHVPGVET